MGFLGGLLGEAIGGLTNAFGGGQQQGFQQQQGQQQKGLDAMQASYGQGRDQLQPLYGAGMGAIPQYQASLNTMANPVSSYNNIMGQYDTSPAAKFQMQQMQKAMDQSAAAGGTLGSPSQQQALAQYSQGLTSNDMQNFFGNVMGIQGQYQSGLGNLIGQGANAAGQLNNNFMGQGTNQGMLYNAMGNSALGSAEGKAAGQMGLASAIGQGFNALPDGTIGKLFGGGGSGNVSYGSGGPMEASNYGGAQPSGGGYGQQINNMFSGSLF